MTAYKIMQNKRIKIFALASMAVVAFSMPTMAHAAGPSSTPTVETGKCGGNLPGSTPSRIKSKLIKKGQASVDLSAKIDLSKSNPFNGKTDEEADEMCGSAEFAKEICGAGGVIPGFSIPGFPDLVKSAEVCGKVFSLDIGKILQDQIKKRCNDAFASYKNDIANSQNDVFEAALGTPTKLTAGVPFVTTTVTNSSTSGGTTSTPKTEVQPKSSAVTVPTPKAPATGAPATTLIPGAKTTTVPPKQKNNSWF